MFQRGDIVIFTRQERTYVIGQASEERARVTVGLVTSVSREGKINAFRDLSYSSTPGKMANSMEKYATQYRLPKAEWDIAGVSEYVLNRPWSHNPEHTGMPFDSIDQAREELRQFRAIGASYLSTVEVH